MGFFHEMVSLQLMLFCLILLGILARKTSVMGEPGRKALSGLLLNIVLPCSIIHSFSGGIRVSGGFFQNCALMFLLSTVIQALAICGSRFLFRKFPRERRSILSYGIICSNSSFVGLPVAGALFGDLGVMYTSIFQIPIRFTMWTAGLSLFTSIDRREAFRKLLRHPCIVSIFAGVVLMVIPFHLPGFLENTITQISGCTTPISMFVIGSILADAPVKSLFSKDVLLYTFLRLIAFPALILLLLMPFHMEEVLVGICVLMTGMPAGSTTSILADQYGGDSAFASQITFLSTLCSIVTIPLLVLVMT